MIMNMDSPHSHTSVVANDTFLTEETQAPKLLYATQPGIT
jgi:hypothetical protein